MNAAPRPADGDARYSAVRIRRVSLMAALADDPAGLREDWILRTVRGYNTVSEESAARYLRDDVPALAAAGIRVEWVSPRRNPKPWPWRRWWPSTTIRSRT